jgi:hypothetical protein
MLAVADIPPCLEYPKGIPERFWSGEVGCKEFEMKRIGPFSRNFSGATCEEPQPKPMKCGLRENRYPRRRME